jgi:uncharacterized 2Fe-2S/4Fe-4S cluster protein (DUF4445 family)
MYTLKIWLEGEAAPLHELEVEEGTTVLAALQQAGLHFIASPCGGRGICRKCIARVNDRLVLACRHQITEDSHLQVQSGEAWQLHPIAAPELQAAVRLSATPQIGWRTLSLQTPKLSDQQADVDRVRAAVRADTHAESVEFSYRALRDLPRVLRAAQWQPHLFLKLGFQDGQAVSARVEGLSADPQFAAPPSAARQFTLPALAVDVGTTTIVSSVLDLANGEVVRTVSELNHQKAFGDDVISRASYIQEHGAAGRDALQRTVVSQLAAHVTNHFEALGLREYDGLPLPMLVAGNTIMMHLLYGLDPEGISLSPFVPVTLRYPGVRLSELASVCNAGEALGSLASAPDAGIEVEALPGLSGYIGGDVVGSILATGLDEHEEISLLVDLGTNGEIVLGNRDHLWCCSTAAGPAFEGATISCGIGGVEGAVTRVSANPEDERHPVLETIGEVEPIGVTGSGLLDTVAYLLDRGTVDETGAMERPYALSKQVWLTPGDIRELQLAKAAISAGIRTLLSTAGIDPEDVSRVYFAGTLGSHIDAKSAARIGLLPRLLAERTVAIGNGALQGALQGLADARVVSRTSSIAERAEYVELSASGVFQEQYIACMTFEEEER